MARDLLRRGNFKVSQNSKYFGVEVDLLFRNPEGVYKLVEVKSLSRAEYWHFRLSLKQKQRLLFVHSMMISHWRQPVELYLALVTPDQEIHWVPLSDWE